VYSLFIARESQKELQKSCENYTKQMIKFYLSENAVSYDCSQMIKPILDEHLKETKIIEQQLKSYMNTEHFKKLELKHLEKRVEQLKDELHSQEED